MLPISRFPKELLEFLHPQQLQTEERNYEGGTKSQHSWQKQGADENTNIGESEQLSALTVQAPSRFSSVVEKRRSQTFSMSQRFCRYITVKCHQKQAKSSNMNTTLNLFKECLVFLCFLNKDNSSDRTHLLVMRFMFVGKRHFPCLDWWGLAPERIKTLPECSGTASSGACMCCAGPKDSLNQKKKKKLQGNGNKVPLKLSRERRSHVSRNVMLKQRKKKPNNLKAVWENHWGGRDLRRNKQSKGEGDTCLHNGPPLDMTTETSEDCDLNSQMPHNALGVSCVLQNLRWKMQHGIRFPHFSLCWLRWVHSCSV